MNCFPSRLFLHNPPPPFPPHLLPVRKVSRTGLLLLSDKDIQSNVLPSRSPPDLTSWLLKLPDPKQHRLPLALERD